MAIMTCLEEVTKIKEKAHLVTKVKTRKEVKLRTTNFLKKRHNSGTRRS